VSSTRNPETVVVTTAGRSHTDDRMLRQRRYMFTQLARISCFVLAVALPVPLWAKLGLIVGAVALPWMGVVAANAGPSVERGKGPTAIIQRPVEQPERIAIEPGRVVDLVCAGPATCCRRVARTGASRGRAATVGAARSAALSPRS